MFGAINLSLVESCTNDLKRSPIVYRNQYLQNLSLSICRLEVHVDKTPPRPVPDADASRPNYEPHSDLIRQLVSLFIHVSSETCKLTSDFSRLEGRKLSMFGNV